MRHWRTRCLHAHHPQRYTFSLERRAQAKVPGPRRRHQYCRRRYSLMRSSCNAVSGHPFSPGRRPMTYPPWQSGSEHHSKSASHATPNERPMKSCRSEEFAMYMPLWSLRAAMRGSSKCLRYFSKQTPNPWVKRSVNGRPSSPSHRHGLHFLWLGPGVLPLPTGDLKRWASEKAVR
jgi:hypothetical protein